MPKESYGDMLMPDGRKRRSSSPVSVGLDPRAGGAVAIASGQYHSCAIVADGSVHCWGQNNHGQLGRGFSTPNIDLTPRNCPLTSWKFNGVGSLASYFSDWQCAEVRTSSSRRMNVRCPCPWGALRCACRFTSM